MKTLKEALNTFDKKNILVIGDVMLDKYTMGSLRESPEAPVFVVKSEYEDYKAGGAGNVALNVKNLSPNGQVYLFGFIGDDSNGEKLKKILHIKGISFYFEINSLTTIKERVIGRGGGQPQQIVRIDREENTPKRFNEKNIEHLLEFAEKVDKIIISDYAKGTITNQLMESLSPYKNKIIVDPKPANKQFGTLYKGVLLINPNQKEAMEMDNGYISNNTGISLRDYFDSNILITKGKEGMELYPLNNSELKSIKLPIIPQESFEETGAGDTVVATLALGIDDKNTLESIINAAKLGNYAAGITVKLTGTYAPTIQELTQAIQQNQQNERHIL